MEEVLLFDEMEQTSGGKFWGKVSGEHPCNGTGHKITWTSQYVFWIRISTDYNYVPC